MKKNIFLFFVIVLASCSLYANTSPVLHNTASTTAGLNKTYSYELNVTDADIDELNITASNLPEWLSLDITGYRISTLASSINAYGIALDDNGSVYASGRSNNYVYTIAPDGNFSSIAGTGNSGGTIGIVLSQPTLVENNNSDIYVSRSKEIRKINADRTHTKVVELSLGETMRSIRFDSQGRLLYSYKESSGTGFIKRIEPDGSETTIFSGSAYGGMQFTLDNNDTLYYVKGYEIFKVASNGSTTRFAGKFPSGSLGDNGPALDAVLDYYISDIIFDDKGNLYISSEEQDRIRKIDTNGTITTIAGNGTASFSGDGGLATDATIKNPQALKVSKNGYIYFGDSGNDRVRKLTPIYTLRGTPTAANVGVHDVNLSISDGVNTLNKNFTIEARVFPPSIDTNYTNLNILEDSGIHALDINVSDVDKGNLDINITSTNPNLLNVSTSWNGSLSFAQYNNTALDFNLSTIANAYGLATVNIVVSDGDTNVSKSFDVNVTAVDDNASFPSINNVQHAEDNGDVNVTLNATDVEGDVITYSASSSNTNLATVRIVDGKLVISPVSNANGVVSIEVNATSNGKPVTQTFDVNISSVNDIPTLVSTDLTSVRKNNLYSYELNVTDVEFDEVKIAASSLPSWLKLQISGYRVSTLISGFDAQGIALDNNGSVYVSDRSGNKVYKVGLDGSSHVIFGTGNLSNTGNNGLAINASVRNPNGLTYHNGELYVTSSFKALRKIDRAGVVTNYYYNGTSYAGFTDITFDSQGRAFFTDYYKKRLLRKDVNGTVSTILSLKGPNYLALDKNDTLHLTQAYDPDTLYEVMKLDSNGTTTTLAGTGSNSSIRYTGPAVNAYLSSPSGLDFDSQGNLYVVVLSSAHIRKIDTNGSISTFMGNGSSGSKGDGGLAQDAQLDVPRDLEISSYDYMYVADSGNNRVRKLTPIYTLSGTPTNADVGVHDVNLSLSDGTTTVAHNFKVTVRSEPPSIDTNLTNLTLLEDFGVKSLELNVSDLDNDTLEVNITSSDTNLVTVSQAWNAPLSFAKYNNIPLDFNLSSVANANGLATITVLVNDGSNNVTQSFNVNITPVDDNVTLAPLSNLTRSEDVTDFNITLNATDVDGDTISYSVSSSNTNLATVRIVDGKVVISPVANAHGVVSIEVNATTNGISSTQSFDLNLTSVDDAPILNAKTIKVVKDSSKYLTELTNISFVDVDNDAKKILRINPTGLQGSLQYLETNGTWSDINTTFALNNFSQNMLKRYKYTAKTNFEGNDTISMKLSTDGNASLFSNDANLTFNVDANYKPFSSVLDSNLSFNEDSGVHVYDVNASHSDTNIQTLSVTSSDTTLATATIVNGKLIIVPVADAYGSVNITLHMSADDGSTHTQIITLTINNVNDAPKLSLAQNQYFFEAEPNDLNQSINFTYSDEGNVSVQQLSTNNPTLLSNLNANLSTKVLSYTINASQSGQGIIRFNIQDAQGLSTEVNANIKVRASQPQICVDDIYQNLDFNDFKAQNTLQDFVVSDLNISRANALMYKVCRLATVTWSSTVSDTSNSNAINDDGTLETDYVRTQDIKEGLIATITSTVRNDVNRSKTFVLTIPKVLTNDAEIVAKATQELSFENIRLKNSRQDSIFSNLNLMSTWLQDTNVTWASSNANVILTTGVVNRSSISADTNVTLTATLAKGSESNTTSFNVTVKTKPTSSTQILKKDAQWLTLPQIINANKDAEHITTDLSLPTEAPNGSSISWTSSASDVVTSLGVITRDSVLDKYSTLTATLNANGQTRTKTFIVRVLKTNSNEGVSTNAIFKQANIDDSTQTITISVSENGQDVNTSLTLDSSLQNSAQVSQVDGSVKNVLELNASTLTMYVNTDGSTEIKSQGSDANASMSQLNISLTQAKTNVESNGTVKSSLNFSNNNEVNASVSPDGSVQHIVKTGSSTSFTNSNLAGSTVNVTSTGVETSYEEIQGSFIVKAISTTNTEGKTTTKFVKVNTTTGEETELDQTNDDSTPFEQGNQVSIYQETGTTYIKIDTRVSGSLKIK